MLIEEIKKIERLKPDIDDSSSVPFVPLESVEFTTIKVR
jgi:hypothetical protein